MSAECLRYNKLSDPVERDKIYHIIDSFSSLAAKYAIPNEYDKIMSDMGAQNTNAFTSVEETVYQENIPSNAIDRYLSLQSERFREPVFRLFHTELETVYEEKNRSLDSDGDRVYQSIMKALFPTHNYGQQTTLGTTMHLKNPSLTAIKDFYDQHYVPNNMALIMTGDFDPDEVIKKVDAAFSYMKAQSVPIYKSPREGELSSGLVQEILGPDASNVNIAYRLPGSLDVKSVAIAEVICGMLYNGKAGLMDANLNQKQKVLASELYLIKNRDYTVLWLFGMAKQGQTLEQAKDLLMAEMEKLKSGNFDERLIKAIVNNARLNNMEARKNISSRAGLLKNAFIIGKESQWLNVLHQEDEMAKVTKKEIIQFCQKYLNSKYVIVYKRQGKSTETEKIIKPIITPIPINRDERSEFAKHIDSIGIGAMSPKWIDYTKDIQRTKIGKREFLYAKNGDNELFNLIYRFEVGANANPILPHAAKYLSFIGTDKLTVEQINRNFFELACNFDINVQNEFTIIRISGLQRNFNQAVAIFEDLFLGCKESEGALKQLQRDVLQAREDFKYNKDAIAQGLKQYAIYGPKNPFNNQLSNDALSKLTSNNLIKTLRELFQYPCNIIYHGPDGFNTITKVVSRLRLPVIQPTLEAPASQFQKIVQSQSEVLFAEYDMVQADISWIYNSGIYNSDQSAVVNLFNSYFGGGMGSIVFQNIREAKALAYSTYANYLPPYKQGDRYTIYGYVGTQADKMLDAINAMNELISDMPKSEAVLNIARNGLKQDIESERINDEKLIFSYLATRRMGINTDIRKSIYDRLDRLSLVDLEQFHRQNFKDKPYTLCVLGSSNRIDMEALKKLGTVKKMSLEQIFGY